MNETQKQVYLFLKQNGFTPVDVSTYSLLCEYEDDTHIYDRTATLTSTWAFAVNALYRIINGYLCYAEFSWETVNMEIRYSQNIKNCLLKETIDVLYGLAKEAGLETLRIWNVEYRRKPEYEAVSGYEIKCEYSEDHSDYEYRVEDLVDLNGTVNYYKRRRIKKYQSDPLVSFAPVTKASFSACFDALNEWCRHKDGFSETDCDLCGAIPGCGCIRTGLAGMERIFNEEKFGGLVASYAGKPVGFAIWEYRNGGYVFVFYAQSAMTNLNIYLYYTMAKERLFDKKYINPGGNGGDEGLRVFKSHLGAHKRVHKYIFTFLKKDV
ncbi:MAG: hypothetical protein LBC53_07250 [Spirochaetaceae bacterium]|jgi:hypothetical protein|nr:hypothetical protein [Spirochaetaceae bacterium]